MDPIETDLRVKRTQLAEHVRLVLDREGRRYPNVIDAMRRVPREKFVSPAMKRAAYRNTPLPIGCDQTISQPIVVAVMIGELQLQQQDRVLEIGTGSGYAAAILAEVATEVYTIERHARLAKRAERRLRDLGYGNVHVRHGDGRQGWPEHAPFDGIVVAAASRDVPPSLLCQLRIGARLVIPIELSDQQEELHVIQRVAAAQYQTKSLGGVRFVPLAHGAN